MAVQILFERTVHDIRRFTLRMYIYVTFEIRFFVSSVSTIRENRGLCPLTLDLSFESIQSREPRSTRDPIRFLVSYDSSAVCEIKFYQRKRTNKSLSRKIYLVPIRGTIRVIFIRILRYGSKYAKIPGAIDPDTKWK